MGRGFVMALVVAALTIMSACSGEEPCDQCYDDDYYYEHPYFCQECLQEKDDME